MEAPGYRVLAETPDGDAPMVHEPNQCLLATRILLLLDLFDQSNRTFQGPTSLSVCADMQRMLPSQRQIFCGPHGIASPLQVITDLPRQFCGAVATMCDQPLPHQPVIGPSLPPEHAFVGHLMEQRMLENVLGCPGKRQSLAPIHQLSHAEGCQSPD